MNVKDFSSTLRRKRGNLPLRQVEQESGVSIATLSRLEKGGEPDFTTYVKLCRWMGVSLDYFFGGHKGARPILSHEDTIRRSIRADGSLSQEDRLVLTRIIDLIYSPPK